MEPNLLDPIERAGNNPTVEWEVDGYRLRGLGDSNVVLGKNGCGKSRLLQALDNHPAGRTFGRKKYVTPERRGRACPEASIEQTMSPNPGWLESSRRVNQFAQFKPQTAAHAASVPEDKELINWPDT